MRTVTRQYMLDEPEGNNNLFYNYELAETYYHPNEGDYEAYYDLYEEPTSSETTKNYPGFSRAGRTQQPEIVNLNCDSLLKLPHINLPEINARFMIDTGSTRSFISPRKVDEFFANYKLFEPFEVVSTHARSRHDEVIVIPLLKTFKSTLQHKFYVYDVDNRYDGLIGSDLLKQLGATIDMQNQVLRTKNVEIPIIYNPPYEVQLQPRTETRVTIPADLKDGEAIINFVDFGKDDTESMQVNVDESERRLHSYLDDVVSEIERLSNAQPNPEDEVNSISSGEKEETTKHELETEYPILSPSESTITIPEGTMSNMSLSQTVHSAPDMDTNGIPILNEAIDSKPNQMLIYTWNRNEMTVKNISSNNQKILEAHLPTKRPDLVTQFLKEYVKPKTKHFIYFENEIHRKQFTQAAIKLFRKGTVKLFECTKRVIHVEDEEEQRQIVLKYHESKTCHRGINETLMKLKRVYYWNNMNITVSSVINACEICKAMKYDRKPYKPELQLTQTQTKPFQELVMDFFPIEGKYFLTIIDAFSKLGQTFEIPNRSTPEVVRALIKYFSFYGVPGKDKPRFQKAEVVGEISRNIVPVDVRNRNTNVPIKDIRRPPQGRAPAGGPVEPEPGGGQATTD
ncbi:uncharacterized protein LOC126375998 [Pectinophora gossypiella]|uniref:uncharacterized protein LOC126375998 n=1 Tax=Pectinophora gossypiella TaxID=13191 RepID=UPI00214E3B50|nr:uncharacterized protein LOC126375998 [Pectinophora gossypiella]